MNSNGFIKLIRSEQTAELLHEPNAFALLTLIALRAKRTNSFSVHNLKPGQALIGDHESIGLTEMQYRTAKKKLQKWQLASFKTTNKGTIATLIDKTIYDINEEIYSEKLPENNGQVTSQQRTNNELVTTNKNERMQERKNNNISSDFLFELFEQAIRLYPGDKRSAKTEFEELKAQQPNWQDIVPALESAIELQVLNRQKLARAGEFVPPWKHFKRYIRDRCWESRIG